MEIFRFIKWLWNDIDTPTKYAILIVVALCISVVVSFFVKLTVGDIFFFALVSVVFIGIIHVICESIHVKWEQYKRIKDREADEIVRTLSGRNNCMDFGDEDECDCIPHSYQFRKIDKKLHIK